MNDQFTETTTNSWGSRITNAFKGVITGFLMFIASFGVLYWNEGRVDLSEVAKQAIEIDSTEISSNDHANDKLISTTGVLESSEKIGDTFLQEGNYLSLSRRVEMYAWDENVETSTQKNVGGSETTTKTYSYEKEWTSSPSNSANFKHPEGHANPQMKVKSSIVRVNEAKIGNYQIDVKKIELPSPEGITLTNDNVILDDDFELTDSNYLYNGVGTIDQPEIGDIRISYAVLNNPIENATVFGKLDIKKSKISPFYGPKNSKLYRAFEGTRDSAISTLKTEHEILTWGLRLLGFLLMWGGLASLFGPISVFLDVLPIFGSISRAGISLITFVVALVLSIVTIIVSMILHNLVALIIAILLVIAGIVWYLKKKNNKVLANRENSEKEKV